MALRSIVDDQMFVNSTNHEQYEMTRIADMFISETTYFCIVQC